MEAEVARLKARLEEEEDWQKKILERLEKKASEDAAAQAAHRIVEEVRASPSFGFEPTLIRRAKRGHGRP